MASTNNKEQCDKCGRMISVRGMRLHKLHCKGSTTKACTTMYNDVQNQEREVDGVVHDVVQKDVQQEVVVYEEPKGKIYRLEDIEQGADQSDENTDMENEPSEDRGMHWAVYLGMAVFIVPLIIIMVLAALKRDDIEKVEQKLLDVKLDKMARVLGSD